MPTPFGEDFSFALELKASRKAIAKEQRDVYNRLRSIVEDSHFVAEVADAFGLPLVANLRCGAWYVNPSKAAPGPAYFKSTDGHHPVDMQFNLRRANLHLLPLIVDSGGIIVVDSTRKGKRYPDALSKTIPAWCATLNEARRRLETISDAGGSRPFPDGGGLVTLPTAVGRNEHSQIEGRIPGFADLLTTSAFDLSRSVALLDKPLHPVFVSPVDLPDLRSIAAERSTDRYPVVCVSASKLVEGGSIERSHGFSYVQGSGDDHELWSEGLTPSLFWRYQRRLLTADRSELAEVIRAIVEAGDGPDDAAPAVAIRNTCVELRLGKRIAAADTERRLQILVETAPSAAGLAPPTSTHDSQHAVSIRPGIHAMDDLSSALTAIVPVAVDACHLGRRISIETGDDKVAIDAGVALCVSILGKATIRRKLQWVIEGTDGEANPSRAALKRVNDYFLSRAKR